MERREETILIDSVRDILTLSKALERLKNEESKESLSKSINLLKDQVADKIKAL